MTTIDEVRDIAFKIIRKLNDFVVDLTREEEPAPRRIVREEPTTQMITGEEMDRRIERVRRILNPTLPTQPPFEQTIN